MITRLLSAFFCIVACLFAVVADARAEDPKTSANDHFKKGVEYYESGNFAPALVEFKRAYDTFPAYQVLFNIARTQTELHDWVSARASYERYLAEGQSFGIEPERRAEVEKDMANLTRHIGVLSITTTAGASVRIDGTSVGEAPLATSIRVNEGSHTIRSTLAGHDPAEKTLQVDGGDTITIDMPLGQIPSPIAPAPTTPEARDGAPWWLWGTAGTFAVGAGIVGGLAISASNDASDIRKNGGTISDYESAETRMRTLSITTDVLAIMALGVGVTALVLTLSGR